MQPYIVSSNKNYTPEEHTLVTDYPQESKIYCELVAKMMFATALHDPLWAG